MRREDNVEDISDRGLKTKTKHKRGINRTCSESSVGLTVLQPVLMQVN